MSAGEVFAANTRSVHEMLFRGDLGLYIPAYQRPYRWGSWHVVKLLDDIVHGINGLVDEKQENREDSFTFLGTVITIRDDKKSTIQPIVHEETPATVLTVIDGQQRLTTLMVLCIALHYNIAKRYNKYISKSKREEHDVWLDFKSQEVLEALMSIFLEKRAVSLGNFSRYPKMIRAFIDQWSIQQRYLKYNSPIARFIKSYIDTIPESYKYNNDEEVKDFKIEPRDGYEDFGESALLNCYKDISKYIRVFGNESSELKMGLNESFPKIDALCADQKAQKCIMKNEFPPYVTEYILSIEEGKRNTDSFVVLLRLILLSRYILERVAVTDVRGKDEDYAFSIFESLNSTGEPLTAFETFKPRVVSAEKLEEYEESESYSLMNEISKYISEFSKDNKKSEDDTTRDLLISFALSESGTKLTARLQEQRNYLKNQFSPYENDPLKRRGFIRNIRDVSFFIQNVWNAKNPRLPAGVNHNLSEESKICIAFLSNISHTVTIALLSRYFASAYNEPHNINKWMEFEEAIKAVTAFSVLWRSSRLGTKNIDLEYRHIMSGVGDDFPAHKIFSRIKTPEVPPVAELKNIFIERLFHEKHGSIQDQSDWLKKARRFATYSNHTSIIRFLLLTAYHDTTPDVGAPGLVAASKGNVFPLLSLSEWLSDRWESVEHVAPKTRTDDWDSSLYDDRINAIDCIGNLVLLPSRTNSCLNNRKWDAKRIIYQALSEKTAAGAENILKNAPFNTDTAVILAMAQHNVQLESLSSVTDWNLDIIEVRANRLLKLAWDRLFSWLG